MFAVASLSSCIEWRSEAPNCKVSAEIFCERQKKHLGERNEADKRAKVAFWQIRDLLNMERDQTAIKHLQLPCLIKDENLLI